MHKCFAALLLLVAVLPVSAQFNVGVGLDAGLSSDKSVNTFADVFNEAELGSIRPLEPKLFMPGVQLSLRADFEPVGLEVGAGYHFATDKAERRISDTQTENYKFSRRAFRVFVGPVIGSNRSLDFSPKLYIVNRRIRTDHQITNNKKLDLGQAVNDWLLGAEFGFGYHVPGNANSHLALRPYLRIDFGEPDYSDLTTAYDLPAIATQPVMSYGLSFILYNGPQRR